MGGLITWVGSRACDVLAAVGAEDLVARSCSQTNSIYGVGLITCVGVGLLALGFPLLGGRACATRLNRKRTADFALVPVILAGSKTASQV